jgi:hypothetical protein
MMNLKLLRVVLVPACCLLLSNCASIFNRSSQPVTLSSSPSGATVKVTSSDGKQVYAGTTPTTAMLATSRGYFRGETYTVQFSKAGCPSHTVTLDARISGWYFGNFVIGGLIGMLIVDPLTGSMWTLDDTIAVDLKSAQPSLGLRMMDRESIPAAWVGHLVPVKS